MEARDHFPELTNDYGGRPPAAYPVDQRPGYGPPPVQMMDEPPLPHHYPSSQNYDMYDEYAGYNYSNKVVSLRPH